MADNVAVTPGTGATIAADELTIGGQSVKVQRVKLVAGKDGEYVGDVGGANVDGDANRSAFYVRERPDVHEFVPAITVNTAAYAAGDCLGGKITIANAVAIAGNVLRVLRIHMAAKVDQGSTTIYLFNDDPSSTTFTDHAAFPTIADADMGKLRLLYAVGGQNDGTHYTHFADRNFSDALPDIPLVGTSLFMALKVAGTPDFVASTDFKLVLSGERL